MVLLLQAETYSAGKQFDGLEGNWQWLAILVRSEVGGDVMGGLLNALNPAAGLLELRSGQVTTCK